MAYDRFTAVDENNQFPPGVDVVKRTGDTMTGPLAIEQDSADPQLTLRWNATQGGTIRPAGGGEISFRNLDNTVAAPIGIGEAEAANHAATKGYVDGLGQKNWYTPLWHQDGGSNLAIGNGTLTGAWSRVGDLAVVSITLTRGSTTNQGSAGYLFDLPPEVSPISYKSMPSSAYIYKANGAVYPCTVAGIGLQTVRLHTSDGAIVNQSTPATWGVGDIITMNVTFIAA